MPKFRPAGFVNPYKEPITSTTDLMPETQKKVDEEWGRLRIAQGKAYEAGADAMLAALRKEGESFKQTPHIAIYSITICVEGKSGTLVFIPDDTPEVKP